MIITVANKHIRYLSKYKLIYIITFAGRKLIDYISTLILLHAMAHNFIAKLSIISSSHYRWYLGYGKLFFKSEARFLTEHKKLEKSKNLLIKYKNIF
jgi:hypothetical protein